MLKRFHVLGIDWPVSEVHLVYHYLLTGLNNELKCSKNRMFLSFIGGAWPSFQSFPGPGVRTAPAPSVTRFGVAAAASGNALSSLAAAILLSLWPAQPATKLPGRLGNTRPGAVRDRDGPVVTVARAARHSGPPVGHGHDARPGVPR